MKNCILLDMSQATHPDIEMLGNYDVILLPKDFRKFTNKVIRMLYAPLRNVFYYDRYVM